MRISDWSSDVCSSDLKTSLRAAHDAARAESGAAEVVFFDEPGFVTEGSWSNVFVERDGVLLTPPLSLGLLPGVLRAALIERGRAPESHLRVAALAGGLFLRNSLRGPLPARLAAYGGYPPRPDQLAPPPHATG